MWGGYALCGGNAYVNGDEDGCGVMMMRGTAKLTAKVHPTEEEEEEEEEFAQRVAKRETTD
jgi:hypothetical protein